MKRDLRLYEKQMLEEGNEYTFGGLFREFYPDEAEAEGFDLKSYVNKYRAFIEFNAEDKIYTFVGERGKYYFDTSMDCIGFKEW